MTDQSHRPSALARAWAKWKRFGARAGEIFGIVLFTIMYWLLFAPVALFFKARGRRFLPQLGDQDKTWYLPKEKIDPTLEYMKRQW